MQARRYAGVVSLGGGQVFVAGGADGEDVVLASAERFDPHSRTWRAVSPMPTPRARPAAARLADGRILVAGGSGTGNLYGLDGTGTPHGLSAVELYDPSSDTWSSAAPLLDAQFGAHAFTLADGRVLVIGGQSSSGPVPPNLYDPRTNSWSRGSATALGLFDKDAVPLDDGRVFFAGLGVEGRETAFYDPAHDAWSEGPRLRAPQPFAVLERLPSGRILIASGEPEVAGATPTAERFDPADGSIEEIAPPSQLRHPAHGLLLTTGEVLLFGGETPTPTSTRYDERTDTWSAPERLPYAPRSGAIAVALPEGEALLAGGGQDFSAETERLPNTAHAASASSAVLRRRDSPTLGGGSWCASGSLAEGRGDATLIALPDGRVLAAGGALHHQTALSSAELWDPRSGEWHGTASMAVARAGAAGVVLSDGSVLVAGGLVPCNTDSYWCATPDVERFDPVSETWTTLAPMPVGNGGFASAFLLDDGRVFLAGGYLANGVPQIYDPRSDSWSELTAPVSGTWVLFTPLADGRIAAFQRGAERGSGLDAFLFDPVSGAWTASTGSRRVHGSATLLNDGRVLLAGEETLVAQADGAGSGPPELFDPTTGSWTDAPLPPAAVMTDPLRVRLSDGTPLFVGGHEGTAPVGDAAFFDVSRNAWTSVGSLEGTLLVGATAAAVPGNGVLVLHGGAAASGDWGGEDETAHVDTERFAPTADPD